MNRFDQALARLAAQRQRASRRESWWARTGDVLVRAGRHREARAAYQQAFDAIRQLPPRTRASRAVVDLEADINARIAALPP